MRRSFKVICLFLILSAKCLHAGHFLPEFKLGTFRPTSDLLSDIFANGWTNCQFELSYTPFNQPCMWPFDSCCEWWQNIYIWGSVNHLYDKGLTLPPSEQDDTSIRIIPIALGLKYIYPLPWCFALYGSAGLKYFFLRIDNDNDDVERRERADGLGGVLSLGALFSPFKCFVIDFFVDYSHKHFDPSDFRQSNEERTEGLDISGFTIGIGAGVWF